MALSKFLFTTEERRYAMSTITAGDSLVESGESLSEFGSESFSDANQTLSDSSGILDQGIPLASAGGYVAGGLSYAASGVSYGMGYLLKGLSSIASSTYYMEMYMNPDTMSTSYKIPNQKTETNGGVVINHYRPELPVIKMGGAIGWIRNESMLDSAVNNFAKELVNSGSLGNAVNSFKDGFKTLEKPDSFTLSSIQRFREQSRNLANSPRKFMENLEWLVLSPMYYYDNDQVERYNRKIIVVFTKRHPNGVALYGYFEDFSYKETGKDSETIKYDLTFVVTDKKPLTIQDRIGQFIAPFYGAATEVGGAVSNLSSSASDIGSSVGSLFS